MTNKDQAAALRELAAVMEKHNIFFMASNEHDLLDEFTTLSITIGDGDNCEFDMHQAISNCESFRFLASTFELEKGDEGK